MKYLVCICVRNSITASMPTLPCDMQCGDSVEGSKNTECVLCTHCKDLNLKTNSACLLLPMICVHVHFTVIITCFPLSPSLPLSSSLPLFLPSSSLQKTPEHTCSLELPADTYPEDNKTTCTSHQHTAPYTSELM